MNARKTILYLLCGLFAILIVGALLFPMNNGAAADKGKSTTDIPHELGPPNFDALASVPEKTSNLQNPAQVENGRMVQVESRFDVPTFLWTAGEGKSQTLSADSLQRSKQEEDAARSHLSQYASRYRLTRADVTEAKVASVHDTGSGAIIVKFKQTVGGVEVFRDELNVIMNRELQVVALSGYLTGDNTDNAVASFNLQPADAVAKAIQDLTGSAVESSLLQPVVNRLTTKNSKSNPYQLFTADENSAKGVVFTDEPSRVKQVMFHLPEGYVPAYYVETSVMVPTNKPVLSMTGEPALEELGYSYVISAVDGQLLFRKNQVAEQSYSYRVWADPVTKIPYDTPAGNGVHPKATALPDGLQFSFVSQQDVALQNFPFSMNDPWLPAGATETSGNNVDAFLNLFSPDGFGNPTTTTPTDVPTGDYRAQITGAGQFLHTNVAGTDHALAEARQGSIQQLFYQVNFLHDWYYDAGFNEASGNAQTNNFGRGGAGADNIKAQVDDFAGFSNANMLTPADGSRPRMRMYVFPSTASQFDVQSPAAAAGKRNIGISMSGQQAFDTTAQVLTATFVTGTCNVTNAAALAGKIAMFDFDNTDGTGCSFSTRLARISAQTSAVGMVMVYTSANPAAVANITGFVATHTKPIATISWNGAASIKTQLAVPNVVTARLSRVADRDGSLDNQIVSHEWGHYISNRLIGNASGINNIQGASMGEGWGDFTAMLLTVRADDTSVPSNATWNGTYGLATYATSGNDMNGVGNNGYYFGIRRLPYSTDMTKNGLTLKHISNGVPLPVGPPTAFGADGSNNAEVHNAGEVWATMLWECYAGLLRDTQGGSPRLTFAQAQTRMKNYLVAAYKMTPMAPTFLEARDAVLAAAFANDPADGQVFAVAFAKRGAGTNAVAPSRYSTALNDGLVESFANNGILTFVGATLDDSLVSYDADGYLDANEQGLLKVTVKNTGMTALTSTTGSVSSTDPMITFPSGNTLTFPVLQPQVPVTVSVPVKGWNMFFTLRTSTFNITVSDPGSPLALATVPGTFVTYTNADQLLATSATDSVEANSSTWTASSNPGLVIDASAKCQRRANGSLNYAWFCPDINAGSDQYLTSPVMTVDGSGSFNLQFDHSWGFEFDAGGNYDGGVVEMSVNGGAYSDVSAAAYNGTVLTYANNVNPLQGRTAFVRNSAGTIHTSLTRAVAPGSTVQVRFRAASDASFGSTGWTIDNIAMTGVIETPFATLVGELTPTAASVAVSGRVMDAHGRSVSQATVSFVDSEGVSHTARTNSFGYYRLTGVQVGHTYVFNVSAKRYNFSPQIVSVADSIQDLNFVAEE
ncbi:MAG TPA: M36 family metallopeptidase [Pyrinomonadaceae bacterium]|nr:M36 family metallopeptidase [Pyrinomonadaceae bacterium]